MQLLYQDGSGIIVRSYNSGDIDFNINIIPQNKYISSDISEELEINDTKQYYSATATIDHAGYLLVNNLSGYFGTSIFGSLTPNIATIDNNGNISRINDGLGIFSVKNNGLTKKIPYNISRTVSTSGYQFIEYVSGSLSKYIVDTADVLVSGRTDVEASASMNLYTTINNTIPTYIRNTGCWLDSIKDKLTCISVANNANNTSGWLQQRAGTLITPQHIALATHYGPYVSGSTFRFVTEDNEVISRQIHEINSTIGYDITICTLNEAVPDNIIPAKILPTGYMNYLPSIYDNSRFCNIPSIAMNQDRKILILDCLQISLTLSEFNYSTDDEYSKYTYSIRIGDSGSPIFLLINNNLVLISTFRWADGGPNLCNYTNEINNITNNRGYTLTEIDLQNFNTY